MMQISITTADIMQAIQKLAAESIAELKRIYIGRVPTDFKRPCLQIQPVTTGWGDANKNLVDTAEYFTLTVYVPTDDYGHSGTDPLLDLQNRVMLLFRPGYLRVKNRAIGVRASTGGFNHDMAFVDVQLDYLAVRDETPDTTPLMERVDVATKEKG